jgi:hypothetical protein
MAKFSRDDSPTSSRTNKLSKDIDGRSKIDELPYPSSTAENVRMTFTTEVKRR